MLRTHLPDTACQAQIAGCHSVTTPPFFLLSPISCSGFTARCMPRRPRPAPRGKPGKGKPADNAASSSKVQLPPPKALSKRRLKVADSEPESEEREDDEESSSDSDGEGDDDTPLEEDSEESDVDVDAPRVAQWVDEDDLEQLETPFGDASHGEVENAEDIVCVVHVSPKFG
jgi:hypothetical protein